MRSLEAAPGIEPGITVLQTIALPLGYAAVVFIKSILSFFKPLDNFYLHFFAFFFATHQKGVQLVLR